MLLVPNFGVKPWSVYKVSNNILKYFKGESRRLPLLSTAKRSSSKHHEEWNHFCCDEWEGNLYEYIEMVVQKDNKIMR